MVWSSNHAQAAFFRCTGWLRFQWFGPGGIEAFIGLENGKLYVRSSAIDWEEPLPEDLDTGPYLMLPDKRDLDLGRQLAIDFAAEYLREDLDEVYAMFRKRGAYRNFRWLLEERDVLPQWYDYEARETERQLRQWCADQGIELVD